eukprot:EG_transcript_21152
MALLGQPISPMPPSGESWLWEWNGMEPRVLLKLCQGHPRERRCGAGYSTQFKVLNGQVMTGLKLGFLEVPLCGLSAWKGCCPTINNQLPMSAMIPPTSKQDLG